MGIFGNSSPFDQDVERVTDEKNTNEDWALILEICDRAGASQQAAKDCLRASMRRLAHPDPHVQVQALTLLDACVANCGRIFHLEVASRDFEAEFRRLLSRAQPAVAVRMRSSLRKWSEGEFRSDPQLDLIPSLYSKLRAEGADFEPPRRVPDSAPATVAAAAEREQDDLARAIALSLRESSGSTAAPALAGTLYPRVDVAPVAETTPPRKVRALYDFEAAEDNELTFLAGEIVQVTDSSDPNWWKGFNERGEGLFPANFVTADIEAPPENDNESDHQPHEDKNERSGGGSGKKVQFAVDEVSKIDEAVLDEALSLLLEADPECGGEGSERAEVEARAYAMGPLIDAALERADRRHARLTQLSADLVDALNLYHELMREPHKAVFAPLPTQGSQFTITAPAHPQPPPVHPPHSVLYAQPPTQSPHPPRC